MNEKNNYNTRIVRLLSIVCVISNLSYYPYFVSNGLGRNIAIGAWILFGVIAIGFHSHFINNSIYRSHVILYIIFVINTVIVGAINGVNSFSNHFFLPVTISCIVFFLSNWVGADIGRRGLQIVCEAYYYVMAFISVPLFFRYLRGTDIVSSIYGYQYGKNEIAVLLLCAMIIACLIHNPTRWLGKAIRVIAIFFFVLDILFLRTRSVFAGILLLAVILILNRKQLKGELRTIIILGIVFVGIYFIRNIGSFDSFLRNIVYAGRNANSLNDISSGRIDQIQLALATFSDNPIFGIGKRFTCDCMYASVLANYGILSWPLWIMAIKPVVWGVKNYNRYDNYMVCFFIIAVSLFVVSILEEQAPFGPGVRCYILWLFWGVLLNTQDQDAYERDAI